MNTEFNYSPSMHTPLTPESFVSSQENTHGHRLRSPATQVHCGVFGDTISLIKRCGYFAKRISANVNKDGRPYTTVQWMHARSGAAKIWPSRPLSGERFVGGAKIWNCSGFSALIERVDRATGCTCVLCWCCELWHYIYIYLFIWYNLNVFFK